MKKTLFVILLFLAAQILNAQPGPPGGLIINHGRPIYCDSAVLFDWDDVSGATSYGLQVFGGSTFIINVSGLPVSEYTAPPYTFNSNTYYYCHINAAGPGGIGPWSGMYHFTTTTGIPNPPALISPADSAYNVSLTPLFDWTDVSGATQYRLQVSTSPSFSILIIDISGLQNSGYNVQPNVLIICTRYYWRVCASNSGNTSNWSAVRTFLTTCPIGISNISSEIPSEYKLYNNCPNPFNPNTIIRFQIKDSRHGGSSTYVKLIVYDILGREVKTLVNEFKKTGIYEVQFSMDGFESGIYFYRLQAGDFSETKKMVLIK